jgi:hypothetical protein
MQIYLVKTRDGIAVRVEANSPQQARQRAQSPLIIRRFIQILEQSLGDIASVEPLRGPIHQIRSLVFTDEFFNKQ